MFQYSQKNANKDFDIIKEMLKVTRGKRPINEDFGTSSLGGVPNGFGGGMGGGQPQAPDMGMMGQDQGGLPGQTDEITNLEKSIQNSVCVKYESKNDSVFVAGYIKQNGKTALTFEYNSKEKEPKIKAEDGFFLNEEILKSINQISVFFQNFESQ